MLVPPSVLMATSAVVLDVDGTIAGPDHRISPRTQAAMAGIERLGVPVVLATGRSRANVLDVAATVGLRTPGVSCNGAVVTDPGSGDDLRVRTMDPDDATALRRVHEETGAAFTWWTARDIVATTERLREIGLPVAMGNALPEARAVARATTGHHANEGAADFLEEVLRQIRRRAA